MLPNKSNLILLGIGIVAGYFLAAQSLQALDFNGTGDGVGYNPFAWGFTKGLNTAGIKTS